MAQGSYPKASSFPSFPVFRCLAYSEDSSKNPFSKNSLLYFDKELVGTPSSARSFYLVSYPSRLWEALPTFYTGHNTFALF
jgi:hypothetical protein